MDSERIPRGLATGLRANKNEIITLPLDSCGFLPQGRSISGDVTWISMNS